jgi:demethylmenaquinone methyltransferase / 2-methoxy-6-polyprenyl-1,4-benzoquinol methylase
MSDGVPRAAEVRAMFGRIARRYDLVNRILSFGLCVGWRNTLVRAAAARRPSSVADLATGSGDVAFALRAALPATTRVAGYDFCEPLLGLARERARREEVSHLEFAQGDCLALPLPDASADVLTIAYGVRNLEDRPRGLRELRRVLRPGGAALILEFSQPDPWFRPLHFLQVRLVAPVLAALITGDLSAYRYLAVSIAGFPDAPGLDRELLAAGFSKVRHRRLLLGTVAIHEAEA